MSESISTLKFANRAKNIKNVAVINEDIDQRSLLRKYERELKKLRNELNNRSRNVVDKRRLLELDEQRRRAEQDKMAAIEPLKSVLWNLCGRRTRKSDWKLESTNWRIRC